MGEYRPIPFCALILIAAAVAGCEPVRRPVGETGVAGPPDAAADRAAVVDAHQALLKAYEEGDVDGYVDLLDPTAELLIFHPSMRGRFDGVEKVRREMGGMFARFQGADWSDHHPIVLVKGDVAWITAQIQIEAPGLDPPFVGRGTEIWVRRQDGWRLAHGHWSSSPEDWSRPAGMKQE